MSARLEKLKRRAARAELGISKRAEREEAEFAAQVARLNHTRCPLDDDRFLATVRALDAANAREAAIWAALSRAGVSHGQSVEGLKEGLAVLATLNARVAELQTRAEALEIDQRHELPIVRRDGRRRALAVAGLIIMIGLLIGIAFGVLA